MRNLVLALLTAVVLWGVSAGAAHAQPFPSIASLAPFAAETNYMSLAGYLRWVSHHETGVWLTYAEAERIVHQQKGGGG